MRVRVRTGQELGSVWERVKIGDLSVAKGEANVLGRDGVELVGPGESLGETLVEDRANASTTRERGVLRD